MRVCRSSCTSTLIIAILFTPPAVVAQDSQNAQAGETGLSLRQLVASVLAQNRQIAAAKLNRQVSEWAIKAEEQGIFEPVFAIAQKYDRGEKENTAEDVSIFNTSDVFVHKNVLQNAGVNGLLPWGTEYGLGSSLSRLENTANAFENEYVSFVGLEITQPLLKGFGRSITEAPVRLAWNAYQIRHQELRQRIAEIVAQAEAAYWELSLRHEQTVMRRDSVRRAEQLLADFRERQKAGKASDLDVYQAETGLLLRVTQVQSAEQQYAEAVNQIRSLLSEKTTESGTVLTPDRKAEFHRRDLDLRRSLALALELHPEYIRQQKQVEREGMRIELVRNERKPQLNLVASFGLNGHGRSPHDAWEDTDRRDFEAWSAGVEFRTGLGGNRRFRNELWAARARREQQQALLRDTEIQLQNSLDTILKRLRSLTVRLASLRNVVEFNEKLLDVSVTRLREGKGDIRQVLEIEEDLVEAEETELSALTQYEKALVGLEALEGTILRNRDIDVVRLYQPDRAKHPRTSIRDVLR